MTGLPVILSPAATEAVCRVAAEMEPAAVAQLAQRPGALLTVLLHAARLGAEAAAPHIAAAERPVLLPTENMVLTVARAQCRRGENPSTSMTTVLVMALDRLLTTGGDPQ